MNFNLDPKININIQDRCLNWIDLNKTYNLIKLKPNKIGTKNILTLAMLLEPNTKYIVIYNFDLNGLTLTIPNDCILEINGGNINNGTLIGNNTILLNTNKVDILLNVIKLGTWRDETEFIDGEDIDFSENGKLKLSDKEYNTEEFSGLGRIYLRKNVLKSINIEDGWYYKLGLDNITYIFFASNNKFYHPHSNGIGLILNYGVVNSTINYDENSLPEEVLNNNILRVLVAEDNTYNIIFPKGVICEGAQPYLDTEETYINSSLLTNIIPFENANIEEVDKNILTQEMFSSSNTRYIIQYDYDLLGETIHIPDNCILDFQGGSISNGQLIGNNIRINNPYKVLFQNVYIGESDNNTKELVTSDYYHEILSESEFEELGDNKRSDTIYFIVET